MKFKLDENLGIRAQHFFFSSGYDVQTLRDQGMQGCSDAELYKICCEEHRCLVSLDMDFADVTRFPPDQTSGIAVIRLPKNPTLTLFEQLTRKFLHTLTEMSIEKHLWIVEVDRIRVHHYE